MNNETLIVIDRIELKNRVLSLLNDKNKTFNLSSSLDSYSDIGELGETITSTYGCSTCGIKIIDIFDADYLVVGYYGGDYNGKIWNVQQLKEDDITLDSCIDYIIEDMLLARKHHLFYLQEADLNKTVITENIKDEVRRSDLIQWGRDILPNYELTKPFEDITEQEFLEYGQALEEEQLKDNGTLESNIGENLGLIKIYECD